jgi:hypothetical protein
MTPDRRTFDGSYRGLLESRIEGLDAWIGSYASRIGESGDVEIIERAHSTERRVALSRYKRGSDIGEYAR